MLARDRRRVLKIFASAMDPVPQSSAGLFFLTASSWFPGREGIEKG